MKQALINNWQERMQWIREMHQDAESRASQEQDRQDKYYNTKHCDMAFQVGDRAWRRNGILSSVVHGVTTKLAPKFVGQYTGRARVGTSIYELVDAEGKIGGLAHVSNLKTFIAMEEEEDSDQEN